MILFDPIVKIKNQLKFGSISDDRQLVLKQLANYIQAKIDSSQTAHLNFICTHNSRRSQFSQIWAQVAVDFFGIKAKCYSGGVEVTAFNDRAVESLRRMGFQIEKSGEVNPIYLVHYALDRPPVRAFSKLFDDQENEADLFATIMTCAHADENCPFIPGAEVRIPVRYEDPKAFDDTPEEQKAYDERSMQIATEMFYVFSIINQK